MFNRNEATWRWSEHNDQWLLDQAVWLFTTIQKRIDATVPDIHQWDLSSCRDKKGFPGRPLPTRATSTCNSLLSCYIYLYLSIKSMKHSVVLCLKRGATFQRHYFDWQVGTLWSSSGTCQSTWWRTGHWNKCWQPANQTLFPAQESFPTSLQVVS